MKRSLLVLLFLVACTTVAPPPQEPLKVVLVGTTDVHGWFNGHAEARKVGGEEIRYGGLALLASYVDALRATNEGRVIVVDSGDLFQGTLESNIFEGEPVIRGFNAIRYTAAAVGNHEFDFGPVGPAAIAQKPGDDPLGALKRAASLARFPMLSANMTEKATGETPSWARRYTIVDMNGAKIGIIGLSTPTTPDVTMPANVVTLQFGDPVAATVRAARDLRAEGADAVVVIAHMGGRCTKLDDPNDTSSCNKGEEANRLLEALPRGTIDAFFAGHTHSQMRHYINGVAIAQALPTAKAFSAVELWVDRAGNRVARTEMRPHTMLCSMVFEGTDSCDPRSDSTAALVPRVFEGREIARDSRLTSLFEPFLSQVATKRNQRLGITTTNLFERNYLKESPLGNLLTDAMRSEMGTDIALINSGGIRSELKSGDLIYADMFEVSPFDNYAATLEMTGAELLDSLRLASTGGRGILQTSGLKYTIDWARPVNDRVIDVTLENGQPLDPNARYKIVMPDFLAGGGDGQAPVMDKIGSNRITIDYSRPLREVFIDALKKRRQPLEPPQTGRITTLNEQQSTGTR